MQNMNSFLRRACAVFAACALSGCAAPLIAGLTLNEMSTAASVVSTVATGKGTGDHALSFITGDDCRVLEGLMSADRKICEKPGSPRTAGDFQGIAGLASAHPADSPSLKEHSMGPMASTLADRNSHRLDTKKTTLVAAAPAAQAKLPAPLPAPAPVAATPAAYVPAPPATYVPATWPQYY
jgi:hypothetical protein